MKKTVPLNKRGVVKKIEALITRESENPLKSMHNLPI
jgi:hypothetical protein